MHGHRSSTEVSAALLLIFPSSFQPAYVNLVRSPNWTLRCARDGAGAVPKRNRRPQSDVRSRVVMREPTRLRLDFVQLETWQGTPMPYFNFDLVVGADFKSQGGMILENTDYAIDKADSLASELCIVRPELCSTGCAVRVTDGDSNELYRTPIELVGRG